jgi:hypothetical protein
MIVNLKALLDGKVNTLSFEETRDMSDFEMYGVRPFRSGLTVRGTIEKRTGLITLPSCELTGVPYSRTGLTASAPASFLITL